MLLPSSAEAGSHWSAVPLSRVGSACTEYTKPLASTVLLPSDWTRLTTVAPSVRMLDTVTSVSSGRDTTSVVVNSFPSP